MSTLLNSVHEEGLRSPRDLSPLSLSLPVLHVHTVLTYFTSLTLSSLPLVPSLRLVTEISAGARREDSISHVAPTRNPCRRIGFFSPGHGEAKGGKTKRRETSGATSVNRSYISSSRGAVPIAGPLEIDYHKRRRGAGKRRGAMRLPAAKGEHKQRAQRVR